MRGRERPRLKAADVPASVDGPLEQARPFQHVDVLGGGGERHIQRRRELPQ